ncbi:c-type cytochrome biogenesis protein CcmI [Pseudoduganella sp. SL102]|uniref:c-type cytochrome biogenesis protein CcmI n=1 Tax=Pseudoduganella sp. SL102 TaxID=2995154 RepID=UPI00248BDFEB|nr:c-type cytochrome biogenesis protein CcmI [Pseudoduganella sp. SL102]WBS00979.1 c-type cytochrome biogenesis protein CcmI [Pseudoduganella sp. SL102]
MIPFLVIAVAMTAIAMGCVLYPLLRPAAARTGGTLDNLGVPREQVRELDAARRDGVLSAAAHAEAVDELRRRVNQESATPARQGTQGESRVLAGALALLVPLVAAGLYYHTGSPAALAVANPAAEKPAPQHEITTADVSTLVQGLAERMRRDPTDADGWYMLARSYTAIGRYADAVTAYRRLLVLVPDDAAVLADYADVLATVQGGTLSGKPESLVEQALQLEPNNVKALALAGNAAFQRGDFNGAGERWERILPLVPPGSALHQGTLASLAQVRQRTAAAAPTQTPAEKRPGQTAAAAGGLTGTVSLAPELAGGAAPGDAVFIFARAAQGTRTPLAVQRTTVAQLPFRFRLDDSQAMAPGLELSGADRVIVTARISRSGSAMPAKGDLEGRSAAVPADARDIAVRIGERLE